LRRRGGVGQRVVHDVDKQHELTRRHGTGHDLIGVTWFRHFGEAGPVVTIRSQPFSTNLWSDESRQVRVMARRTARETHSL
jgi:hypothetical protein